MNEQELQAYCETNGVPFNRNRSQLRIMDLTQLPEAMRASFDERGVFISPVEVESQIAPAEVSEAVEPPEDLSELTVVELKDRARELEISGFSSMAKDELVKAIKKANK